MIYSMVFAVAGLAVFANAQAISDLPNSYPQDYPGKPSSDFSPEWQEYYLVKSPLPNIPFSLPRSFAGNIGVNRADHPNNTLFFWAFENENGSLTVNTSERTNVPWAIWLNGGPGSSSMIGLLGELGPALFSEQGHLQPNDFSWDKFVDYIFIDQPVGTGFSTADSMGYVVDEDQMAQDFLGFLNNLVKVFPSLATRPLILTGQSYAGYYISYIMKALFSTDNPPVKLWRVAIGNGVMGTLDEADASPVVTIMETFPQLIGYDTAVYEHLRDQWRLCGFDFNFTYPQTGGKFPATYLNRTTGIPTRLNISGEPVEYAEYKQNKSEAYRSAFRLARSEGSSVGGFLAIDGDKGVLHDPADTLSLRTIKEWEEVEKGEPGGRGNGTIDRRYACYLNPQLRAYALNFSSPWREAAQTPGGGSPLNPYYLPDARKPKFNFTSTAVRFLNDGTTRTALHAPTSKNWTSFILYPFNNTLDFSPEVFLRNVYGDPSMPPSQFFDELLANASIADVQLILFNGNNDAVCNHFGNELLIQNTTFGGVQGFTRRPSTPLLSDNGTRIGIVHQERGVKYLLIEHAGHEVSLQAPEAAFVLFRDFILGSKDTGLVNPGGSVIGGEDLARFVSKTNAIPGQEGIRYGNISSTALYTAPPEKINAWNAYLAEREQD